MHRRLALALTVCAFASTLTACGGDDADSTTDQAATIAARTASVSSSAGTTATVDTKVAPVLSAPASRFTLLLEEDLGLLWITDIPATYVLDIANYSKTPSFESPTRGEQLLREWGYQGGYESGMTPEGRETAVLNGSYYINIESHLFTNEDGAKKAYGYFETRLQLGSQKLASPEIGNQRSAWTLTEGKVGKSNVNATFHRLIFRRGNLVVIVGTWGSEPFMKVEDVARLASIVDAKATSQRPATEPTPTSNFKTPTFTPRTPTQALTPNSVLTPTPTQRTQ